MKRFLSVLLSVVMLVSLAIPAGAAGVDVAVEISQRGWEQQYLAYKLADITERTTGEDGAELFSYNFIQQSGDYRVVNAIKAGMSAFVQYCQDTQASLDSTNEIWQILEASKSDTSVAIAAVDAALSEGKDRQINLAIGEWLASAFVVENPDLSFNYNFQFNNIFVPAVINSLVSQGVTAEYTWNIPVGSDITEISRVSVSAGYYLFAVNIDESTAEDITRIAGATYMSGNIYTGRALRLTVKNEAPVVYKGFDMMSVLQWDVNKPTQEGFNCNGNTIVWEGEDVKYIGASDVLYQQVIVQVPKSVLATYDKYPLNIVDTMDGIELAIEEDNSIFGVGDTGFGRSGVDLSDIVDVVVMPVLSLSYVGDVPADNVFAGVADVDEYNDLLRSNTRAILQSRFGVGEGCEIIYTDNTLRVSIDNVKDWVSLEDVYAYDPSGELGEYVTEYFYIAVSYPIKIAAGMQDMGWNTAYAEYPVNPNDSDPTMNKTNTAQAGVVSYGLTVNKTDGTSPLPGAEFKLERLYEYFTDLDQENVITLKVTKTFDGVDIARTPQDFYIRLSVDGETFRLDMDNADSIDEVVNVWTWYYTITTTPGLSHTVQWEERNYIVPGMNVLDIHYVNDEEVSEHEVIVDDSSDELVISIVNVYTPPATLPSPGDGSIDIPDDLTPLASIGGIGGFIPDDGFTYCEPMYYTSPLEKEVTGEWYEVPMDIDRTDITVIPVYGSDNRDSDMDGGGDGRDDVGLMSLATPREQSQFTWSYLPAGIYRLTEITAPAGYYAKDPIYFVVGAQDVLQLINGGIEIGGSELQSIGTYAFADYDAFAEMFPISMTTREEDGTLYYSATANVELSELNNAFKRHGGIVSSTSEIESGTDWYFTDSQLKSGGFVTYLSTNIPADDGYGNSTEGYKSSVTRQEWGQLADFMVLTPGTVEVINTKGLRLPETGGEGTRLFYALGMSALLLGVAAMFIKRRKYQ